MFVKQFETTVYNEEYNKTTNRRTENVQAKNNKFFDAARQNKKILFSIRKLFHYVKRVFFPSIQIPYFLPINFN